jgi:hypothetical protein
LEEQNAPINNYSLVAGLPTTLWVVRDLRSFTKNVAYKLPPKFPLPQNVVIAFDNLLFRLISY